MAVHDSTRPVAIDKTGISFSFGAAKWTVIAFVATLVAVLSVFPFLLSSDVKVATESYVNREVKIVRDEVKTLKNITESTKDATVRIEDNLIKQRASQEAERVTQPITSSDERVKVYQRVYEVNLKRLSDREDPVAPNEVSNFR